MPVLRRRERRRRPDLEELNREQKRTLLTGSGFFGFAFPDEETFAAAWWMHRDRLLPEFIAANPGQRPHAWWRLESKVPHPPYLDPADEGRYSPGAFKVVDGDFAHVTEPQDEYLRRTRQLSKAEITALDADADEDDDSDDDDN